MPALAQPPVAPAEPTAQLTVPSGLRQDMSAASLSFVQTDPRGGIGPDIIAWLKQTAQAEKVDNARICIHGDRNDAFHQMIIVQRRGIYCRPHKHLEKAEGHQIIDGQLASIVFDDDGEIVDIARLGHDCLIYRIEVGQYHMVYPLSGWCVYHETKPGPFRPDRDATYPDWAPAADDKAGRRRLLRAVECAIEGLSTDRSK